MLSSFLLDSSNLKEFRFRHQRLLQPSEDSSLSLFMKSFLIVPPFQQALK